MMEAYIGTKIISAKPMNLGAYNIHRGWDIPKDEEPTKEGYLINYPDGYVSWSPKQQFEEAYRLTDGMNFGLALEALQKGMKVTRRNWRGKDMWLVFVPGSGKPLAMMEGTPYRNAGLDRPVEIDGHIDMYTAEKTMQPGWLASQADMLAQDWILVP